MVGVKVELSEEVPEDKRSNVSGADDDVVVGLGVVHGVVQSPLQLGGRKRGR